MNRLNATGGKLAMLTDLYELTMAYGYWKQQMTGVEAVFHLTFRDHPFHGGFSIACGLEPAIEYLQSLRFESDDLDYLSGLKGNDGTPLFAPGFLRFLGDFEFCCDVDAVPEGTVVFPHEPLMRVRGPIIQSQLVETLLLNIINFETLIATKAARVAIAASGDPVMEFGLRRAQGINGGLAATRAAYVGGCSATSNVLAGKLFDIPVGGTLAHSWVMSFDSEMESFEAYADALPNNCILLVDTYNSIEGIHNAVTIGLRLREQGHKLIGIRLDSGDLAWLSIEARKILDQAGLEDAVIVASNDFDEHIVKSLKEQGAKISVWGVGTRLVTGWDQPALGGVYKLAAVRWPGEEWKHRVKISEQAVKVSNPGILHVRRYRAEGQFVADMIWDDLTTPPEETTIVDPLDLTRRKTIPAGTESEELLVPIFRKGERVYDPPPLAESRRHTLQQLEGFHPGIKRFVNPHQYPVGLEEHLFDLKTSLIMETRKRHGGTRPHAADRSRDQH